MLYGALVVTLWTCYGALQIVVLLLLLLSLLQSTDVVYDYHCIRLYVTRLLYSK